MNKTLAFIIGVIILLFIGYKYFELDKNADFQKSVKEQNTDAAEKIVQEAVSTKLQAETKKFFYEHNNYFVSKSNNVCTDLQSKFDAIKKVVKNPVECVAEVHTFTARIKTGTDKYYCADISGFHTTPRDEPGYKAGLSCK